ncbi:MAG: hypothetical protein FIA94_10340 [Nitrospirae bacterium]|nr:hypothetical protein [Nitrospirota bacterium]
MQDNRTYASYAVMCELNSREFRRRLALFPDEQRYHVVLATGIIGAENAKRIEETPAAIVDDGVAFVEKLLDVAGPVQDGPFRDVLETCLIAAMNDELRYCCANCMGFHTCLDLDNTPVGELFRRRAEGEDTDELRTACSQCVGQALQRTPHIDTDSAHILCGKFRHHYPATSIGEVFNRYADIAAELQRTYSLDYRKIQGEMLRINMDFVEKGLQAEPRKQD